MARLCRLELFAGMRWLRSVHCRSDCGGAGARRHARRLVRKRIHGAESDARPGDQSQLDEQRAYLPLLGGSDGRARRLRSRAASGASLLGGSGAGRLRWLLRLRRLRGLLLSGGRLRRLIGRRLLLLILFWLGTLRLRRLQRPLGGVNRSALCLRIWRLGLRLLWLRLSIRWRLWLVGSWRRSSLLRRGSVRSRRRLRRLRLVARLLRAQ